MRGQSGNTRRKSRRRNGHVESSLSEHSSSVSESGGDSGHASPHAAPLQPIATTRSTHSSADSGGHPLGGASHPDSGSSGSPKDLSLADIQACFHLGLRDAAAKLRICPTTLKRHCRKHEIWKWPNREIKKYKKAVAEIQRLHSGSGAVLPMPADLALMMGTGGAADADVGGQAAIAATLQPASPSSRAGAAAQHKRSPKQHASKLQKSAVATAAGGASASASPGSTWTPSNPKVVRPQPNTPEISDAPSVLGAGSAAWTTSGSTTPSIAVKPLLVGDMSQQDGDMVQQVVTPISARSHHQQHPQQRLQPPPSPRQQQRWLPPLQAHRQPALEQSPQPALQHSGGAEALLGRNRKQVAVAAVAAAAMPHASMQRTPETRTQHLALTAEERPGRGWVPTAHDAWPPHLQPQLGQRTASQPLDFAHTHVQPQQPQPHTHSLPADAGRQAQLQQRQRLLRLSSMQHQLREQQLGPDWMHGTALRQAGQQPAAPGAQGPVTQQGLWEQRGEQPLNGGLWQNPSLGQLPQLWVDMVEHDSGQAPGFGAHAVQGGTSGVSTPPLGAGEAWVGPAGPMLQGHPVEPHFFSGVASQPLPASQQMFQPFEAVPDVASSTALCGAMRQIDSWQSSREAIATPGGGDFLLGGRSTVSLTELGTAQPGSAEGQFGSASHSDVFWPLCFSHGPVGSPGAT